MPVEFALRPRIRLREAAPRPQRSRVRLPRYALPVAAYWLVAAGLTYGFVRQHDAHLPLANGASDETALAVEPTARESRPWWRPIPQAPAAEPVPAHDAPVPEAAAPEAAEPAALSAPSAPPSLEPEPTTDSAALPGPQPKSETVDAQAMSQALASRSPAPARATRATRTPDLAAAEPRTFVEALEPTEAPEAPPPAPPPVARAEAHSGGLPSCEAALESAHQDVDFSRGNGTADLPTSAIAAVLENGAWLGSCGVPASTSLDVCVAIRGGNVIGVSVAARPANAEVSACVRRRASSLQFPYSSHVDIARTRF